MKAMVFTFGIVLFTSAMLTPSSLLSQTLEDGIRLTQQNNGYYTPRAGGLGIAYRGLSDDISALYFNPAGLGLLHYNEFSASLSMLRNTSENNFLGSFSSYKANSTTLNNIGFASPIKFGKSHAAFGANYSRENNFTNLASFNAFNSNSSIVSALIAENPNVQSNVAFNIFLADTNNKVLFSPLKDSVQQNALIREGGGIENIAVGFGVNLSPTLSVGVTLGAAWGSYNYLRDYTESDINNKYNSLDRVNFTNVDFKSLLLRDSLSQDFASYMLRIGIMTRIAEWARLSFCITPPLAYSITEDFSRTATATFDNNDVKTATEEGRNLYTVYTPWVFSAAASAHLVGLSVAASIEYRDLTQLEFSNSNSQLVALNSAIPFQLSEQISWGIGAEYSFPEESLPFSFRAGLTQISSAYQSSISGSNTTIYSFGVGVFLAENIRLDGMLRSNTTTGTYANYGDGSGSSYTMQNKPTVYALQLMYRY